MKIKIIFTEPPYEIDSTVQASASDEKIIIIQDPYNITLIGSERRIIGLDGDRITYEEYCEKLQKVILATIDAAQLEEMEMCDAITVEECKEPPNFEALSGALAHTKIRLASKCDLTFKDCSFSGSLYVNAVANFVKSVKSIQNGEQDLLSSPYHLLEKSARLSSSSPSASSSSAAFITQEDKSLLSGFESQVFFNITIDEKSGKSKLSDHDCAKLAALNNVMFFPDKESVASLRRFTDDQLLSINGMPTDYQRFADDQSLYTRDINFSHLTNPTYFFKNTPRGYALNPNNVQKRRLLDFFSSSAQQRSDYTCGPAALKMAAEYYANMKGTVCDEPISHPEVWQILNSMSEMKLAERVKTTEEVGSEIGDMRAGLMDLGLLVIDDQAGMRSDKYDAATLVAHKEALWDKLKLILELGIPVVVNLHDKGGIGHYEVAIGMDDDQNIIFAEPGRALDGKVEFEVIPKGLFLDRWKNMSEQRHGRYLIIPPNEASAREIESILIGMPHLFNGEPNELAVQRHLVQDQDLEMGEQEEDHSSPTPGSST